jgi:predicted RNA-binding protein Jag
MLDRPEGVCVLEHGDMAKKKAPKPKAKQGIVLVYKADEQTLDTFKAWLEGLAEHVGAPVTVTVDMALKRLAEAVKFRPMPKRLVR